MLKYVLDKERDFIEEVVTKDFLKVLTKKIEENYEDNIKLKEEKLAGFENDKNNLPEPKSQELISGYKQNLAQIQTSINKTKQDIEAIQSNQKQLATYKTYTDKLKTREQILLHAKKYDYGIFHKMFSAEIREKFTEYLKQLDPEKTRKAYDKIGKNCVYEGRYNWIGAVKTIPGSIISPPLCGFMGFIIYCAVKTFIGQGKEHATETLINVMYASLIVSAILSIVLPLGVFIKGHYDKKQFALENKDLNLSSIEVINTSQNQELYPTSKLQEMSQEQENLENNLNEDKPVPTAPPVDKMESIEEPKELNIEDDKSLNFSC